MLQVSPTNPGFKFKFVNIDNICKPNDIIFGLRKADLTHPSTFFKRTFNSHKKYKNTFNINLLNNYTFSRLLLLHHSIPPDQGQADEGVKERR